ncbi:MAG: S8 family peptidase [Cyanobacteriota bacterium]|nr:S8 family peptidase [Cyanobacteriota bacterium]
MEPFLVDQLPRSSTLGFAFSSVGFNLSNPYRLAGSDDYAGSTETSGALLIGSQRYGHLENWGDYDWFAVELTAGKTYRLQQNGMTLADPMLRLRNSKGQLLAINDNNPTSKNSEIIYTAKQSGRHFLDAGSANPWLTGLYSINASDISTTQAYKPSSIFSSVDGFGEANAKRALDRLTGLPVSTRPALGGANWNLDRIDAPSAWAAGATGKGVTVAVIDTGVDITHPDLDSNIWTNYREIPGNGIDDDANGLIDDLHGWDFVDGDNQPSDVNGHGTHIAGIIASENNRIGSTGVAFESTIMPIRVLNAAGEGSTKAVVKGVRYATANGARVINLSLGNVLPSSHLIEAIIDAESQGIVVTMAAGNESSASPVYPATVARQAGLAVGAVDASGRPARFSNRAGRTVLDYVTAPGVDVLSTLPGNRYGRLSGTSMAAPHVAGIAALLLSRNPALTASEIEDLIVFSASRTSASVATKSPINSLGLPRAA